MLDSLSLWATSFGRARRMAGSLSGQILESTFLILSCPEYTLLLDPRLDSPLGTVNRHLSFFSTVLGPRTGFLATRITQAFPLTRKL